MSDDLNTNMLHEAPAARVYFLLQTRLRRLLRVRDTLRDECQPVPPELDEQIAETRKALGIE
jgi:hypothetical protein